MTDALLDAPVVAGTLGSHPGAAAFASVVQRVHHRYACEVVRAYRLCPFFHDPATDFGRFVVVLDRALDVPACAALVAAAGTEVVHLIFPLVATPPGPFERFGNQLHVAVSKELAARPVHASFHPDMEGDTSSSARLVGFLRRAPDPFIQFVPEGLHKGGTQFVDLASSDLAALMATPKPRGLAARLSPEDLARIAERVADIKAERDRVYAEWLDALG